MTPLSRVVCAILLLGTFAAAYSQDSPVQSPVLSAETGPGPSHLALLIAVNEYQDPSLPALEGGLADIEAMSSVLIGRFGFSQDSISVLNDADATRDAIIREIEGLIETAGSETTVVVHFSGLGSAVRDMNGDEADGWDDSILPFDSGRGKFENRDITDDEFEALFGRLANRSRGVTVIIDASVGGTTVARGSGQVRAAPADYRDLRPRAQQIEPGRNPTSGAGARMATLLLAGRPGSAVVEAAFGDPNDPFTAGVFTYHLSRRLWEVGSEAQWEDVFRKVVVDVDARSAQGPAFTGDIGGLIFDSPSNRPLPYFTVLSNSRTRGVVIAGGALRGLSIGSSLDLFPRGTEDFSVFPMATARIASVDVTTSTANIVAGEVSAPAWAILSGVRYEKSKIGVRLNFSEESNLAEQLRERLESNDLIELVDDNYDLLVRETQGELQVEGAATSPWREQIDLDRSENAVNEVLSYVDRRAQWLSLFELSNPSGSLDVRLDVVTVGGSTRGGSGTVRVRDGETYTVRITNNHSAPVFPLIIGLSAFDEAHVLYPDFGRTEVVQPGEWRDFRLNAFIEEGLTRANDVLKLIASTEPIGNVNLNRGATRGFGVQNSLSQLLDYHALGSLGETIVDPRTWMTTSVGVEVVKGLILWVDDTPDSNRFLRERFRTLGWDTVIAQSGREALDLIESGRFEVVISDFARPGDELAGYGLLDVLNERRGAPPLIYYVGRYTAEQAAQARDRGALDETNSTQKLLDLVDQIWQSENRYR